MTAAQTSLACVRILRTSSAGGRQLRARLRYTTGGTYSGWRDVACADLQRHTGQPLSYWQQLNEHACDIVDRVNYMRNIGAIPDCCLTEFAELHAYFDADTGWSPAIDDLSPTDWDRVQWLVTDYLRFPSPRPVHESAKRQSKALNRRRSTRG